MNILVWLILGALAGWLASKIMNTDAEQGWMANIIVGIVGAVVGGFLLSLLLPGEVSITGFNLMSIIVAIIGAVLVLAIYKALAGRKAV